MKFHMMTHAKSIFLKYSSNRHGPQNFGGLKPPPPPPHTLPIPVFLTLGTWQAIMLLGKSSLVVAMKKRMVSQAEYALQLLIHEISHDDSCQIYIFEVQQ